MDNPTPTTKPRLLRCSTCGSVMARQLPSPDGSPPIYEIVKRRVVIALVRCGRVGCPTCGRMITVGTCLHQQQT